MYVLGCIIGVVLGALPIIIAIKVHNAIENHFLRREVKKFFFHDLPQTEAGRALLRRLIDERRNGK